MALRVTLTLNFHSLFPEFYPLTLPFVIDYKTITEGFCLPMLNSKGQNMQHSRRQRDNVTNQRLSSIEEAVLQIQKTLNIDSAQCSAPSMVALSTRLQAVEQRLFEEKTVLSTTEACQYMGIAESYLYKLTSAKKIPHYKPNGRMIYFNKQELDQWLLSNPIGATSSTSPIMNPKSVAQQ